MLHAMYFMFVLFDCSNYRLFVGVGKVAQSAHAAQSQIFVKNGY